MCDSDGVFLRKLEEELKISANKLGETEVITVCDKENFIEVTREKDFQSDVIIMNIQIDKESGIDLVKQVKKNKRYEQVIFLADRSCYLDYIQDVYEVDHTYFIMKEQLDERLPYALDKVKKIAEKNANVVVLKNKNLSVFFNEKDMVFCTRSNRMTEVYLENGEKVIVSLKLDELQKEFTDPSIVRCHKSFIVSMRYVTRSMRSEFVLSNGSSIPISRPYIYECRERYQEWVRMKTCYEVGGMQ